jgi:16S rRNA (uracil1498-N3)-methyltransferase
MIRFFVSSQALSNDKIVLTGDNAAHAKVLRLKSDEQVIVCDGQGYEALCLASVVGETLELQVQKRFVSKSEPSVLASVYMAFSKGDKFEHVIQKATELGAGEIIAFPSSRCVSKPDDKSIRKKLERWQKIAASAAEQSGRGKIPVVTVLQDYASALHRAALADVAVLFYENEHATTFRMALEACEYRSVSLISGPEGGFSEKEVEQALQAGLQVCTLGSRILRCETAPLCALSALMYASGEF